MHRTAAFYVFAVLAVLSVRVRADAVPFDSDSWILDAREQRIEEHLGRPSLYLKGGIGWIEGSSLLDGVIEFDISFTGERGFVGAIWRIQDRRNYEEFYVRPHQTGKPDATQYTPIFHGAAGWQLYHGEGYGAPVDYRFNAWIKVRIVFAGQRGEVYIDDMETPAVVIHELKRRAQAGDVGVMAGNFAPAWFSNFSFEPANASALRGEFVTPTKAEPGTVMNWLVSTAFEEAKLADKTHLTSSDQEDITWTGLPAESNGVTNLARVQGIEGKRQTVFARVTLVTDEPQTVHFRLGYSDRVKVYLNSRLIYAGDNTYQTRDFRYPGTIGLFDSLYLPLEAGPNSLWIAVSESFGGWGLIGKLEEASGIQVQARP